MKIKPFLLKSGVFAISLVFANLFLMNAAYGQVTKTWLPTNGGNWLISNNWSPAGVPGPTDYVLIPVDQSAAITRSSSNDQIIPLTGLTINGNVNFQFDPGSANFCTINITGTFTVAAGKTFTVGIYNSGRMNFTLASTAIGTVNGTVFMSGNSKTFTALLPNTPYTIKVKDSNGCVSK